MSSESPAHASVTKGDADDETSKSAVTTTPAASSTKQQDAGLPTAVEFEPPLACVRRILKHSLPSSTNVGKDASAAFARATGIFIIYLTSCANDFARENKRQTITANDVLAATKELDFEQFLPEMTQFLEHYRATEKSKKDAKAKAAADKVEKAKDNEGYDEDEEDDHESHDENGEEHDESQKRGHEDISAADTQEAADADEAATKKLKTDRNAAEEALGEESEAEETPAEG